MAPLQMGKFNKEGLFGQQDPRFAQIGSAISKKYQIPVGEEFIIADLDVGH